MSQHNSSSLQQDKGLASKALRAGQSLKLSMRPFREEMARSEQNEENHAILLAFEQTQRYLGVELTRQF